MFFADRIARPAIECVVERKACFQLHKIILVHTRKTERCGEQASRLRREIEACRICTTHNDRKTVEGLAVQAEFLDHHIEGAELTPMAPIGSFDIESCCPKSIGDVCHFG